MKVLVNGCFDCLHEGHRAFLKTATSFGDLIIGVNSDASVRALKGEGRPLQSWIIRAMNMAFLYGNAQEISNADEFVQRVNPDIIVRGWDQTVSEEDRKHIVVLVPKLTPDSTTENLKHALE